MRHERRDHLEAGALVHEALLRLLSGGALAEVPDRRHLRTAAAQDECARYWLTMPGGDSRQARGPPGPCPPGPGPGGLRRAGAGRDRPASGPRTPGPGLCGKAQVVTLRFSAGCLSPRSSRPWGSRTQPLRPTGGSHGPGCAASLRLGTMTSERGQRVYAVFEAALKWDPAGRVPCSRNCVPATSNSPTKSSGSSIQDAKAERDRLPDDPDLDETRRIAIRQVDWKEIGVRLGAKAWERTSDEAPTRRPRCHLVWPTTPIMRSSGNSAGAAWESFTWPTIGSWDVTRCSR